MAPVVRLATETKIAVAMAAEAAMLRMVFIAAETQRVMLVMVVPKQLEAKEPNVVQVNRVSQELAVTHGEDVAVGLAAAAVAAGSAAVVDTTTAAAAAALATLTPA